MSELHAAVQNDLALARTLLGDGDGERCDYGGVNIEDVGGSTPMHWAAASNSVGGVRLLAASGGELEWINQDGHSPLSIAAQEGHTESLRALMDAGALAESTDGFGEISPLLIAAFNNRPECVRALLEAGAQTEIYNALGYSPMALACLQGHTRVVQLLSSFSANRSFRLFQPTRMFDTAVAPSCPAVMFAVRPDSINSINLSAMARSPFTVTADTAGAEAAAAEVDAVFRFPTPPVVVTAEQVAAAKGYPKLLAWLQKSRGWSPLHHLDALTDDKPYHTFPPAPMLSAEQTRTLLSSGADVHAAADNGSTPLNLAAAIRSTGELADGSAADLLLRQPSPGRHARANARKRAKAKSSKTSKKAEGAENQNGEQRLG